MKKISGTGFVLNKSETMLFTFARNTVYQYSLPDYVKIKSYKAISNISNIDISDDETKLATLNTSGTIAVFDLDNGNMLGKSRMERCEGSSIHFMDDNIHILFSDWNGKVMLLDITNFKHQIMYDFQNLERKEKIFIHFDSYNRQLLGIESCSKNIYFSELECIKFTKKVFDIEDRFEDSRFVIHKNFYLNSIINEGEDQIIIYNHKFEYIKRIFLPLNMTCRCFCLSQNGKYLFVGLFVALMEADKSILYDLNSMKIIKEYNLKYVCFANFILNDCYIVISTWKGTFVERIFDES